MCPKKVTSSSVTERMARGEPPMRTAATFLLTAGLIFGLLSPGPVLANDDSNKGSPSSDQPARRALSAPLDGVFPGSDYLGPSPLVGVPDTDPVYPLTRALWRIAPGLKD